jgi:MoxR-like ATPase
MRCPHVPTLFVTGAPGSGKTTLAREMSEILSRVGEPHALIDLDELTRGLLPKRSLDFNLALAIENLRVVWENYNKRGVRRALLARVVLSEDDIDRFARAIPGCHLALCRVVSDRGVEARRISERDPGISSSFLAEVGPAVSDHVPFESHDQI